MKLNELYEKYFIKSDGLQRRYIQDVNDRRYDLDHVTPIELAILVPEDWNDIGFDHYRLTNKKFENRSWVQMLKELITYLQASSPIEKEKLLAYRTDWSKAPIFSDSKSIDNMVEIEDGLFLNVNHTATHSAWIIGDLLSLFDINVGYLILHKPPLSEPHEVKEIVGKMRREEFKRFLISEKGKDEVNAAKIVNNFETLNKILVKMGSSYNDFFLFDDTTLLSNFKSKLLKNCGQYMVLDEKKEKTIRRYLDYLTDYYTMLFKEAKNHKEDLEFYIPII